MKKKKSFIRILLPWLITAVLITLLVVFVGIPLYGPKDTTVEKAPVISYYEGKAKSLTMENDTLLFTMDPETTQFSVTDKVSGEVWHSNPEDAASDPIALSMNKDALSSTLKLTYQTKSGAVELNNYTYSIVNQNYTLEQREDGSIAVNYSIGKIEKIYLLPSAVPKERFEELMDRMDSKTQKKVKSNYSLYEPEKLDSKKNKDEIVALYPEVLNQALYILATDTSENNKKKIAGYFEASGYTQEDYDADQQYVAGKKDNSAGVFNVTVVYRLDGEDLVVEVPYENIRYKSDYPIVSLTVLPMFGAIGTSGNGYLFVPEGGGALIRCNNGKLSQNSYYANVYGWDFASERSEVVSETRVDYPVFGVIRENSSFICMIEGCASYGAIQADIANRYNSYNWINAKYTVLHSDQYNVSAKTAQLVYMYEEAIPDDTVVQRYHFLNSASYVDMATCYGKYLAEREDMSQAAASEEMPVSVEVIGSIDKTVVKFGLPVDSVIPTTTFAQAESIINDLTDGGLKNLHIRYNGWCNGGINQRVLTSVHVERSLGGENGMKKLIAAAKEKNVKLYFDGISCFAYDSDLLNGFISFTDAARFTTREQVYIHPYDIVTYEQAKWLDAFYLVKAGYADRMATNLRSKLAGIGSAGIGYRDIGYLLSADYASGRTTTREQVLKLNVAQMKASKDAGLSVAINEGNEYALPYADIITNMDVSGLKYSILDEQIPFYQIALHGKKDYTPVSLNMSGNWKTELLRCAEYGCGLNFTVMAENAKILQDTTYSMYCGANYDSWKQTIVDVAAKYQQDMAGLNTQAIVDHDTLQDGVTATTYQDGTTVYVNYTNEDCTTPNGVVQAMSYLVERK